MNSKNIRTISFYMPSSIEGAPKEIKTELGQMFVACVSYLKPKELEEIKDAYPLAFAFVEAI